MNTKILVPMMWNLTGRVGRMNTKILVPMVYTTMVIIKLFFEVEIIIELILKIKVIKNPEPGTPILRIRRWTQMMSPKEIIQIMID